MAERSEKWPEGTPNWVDLSAADLQATTAFYAALFGWEMVDAGPEAGHYHLAMKDGRLVAGIGPLMNPDDPLQWTTYIAADSADAVAARIKEAGGKVLLPAMDVMDNGRMAIVEDAAGAYFGLWGAGTVIGVNRYNEPGTLVWNELHVPDVQAAAAFYAKVYGFEIRDMGGEGFAYATFDRTADGDGLGGIMQEDAASLPGGYPYWLTWFGTSSADSSAELATHLGAEILSGPEDSPQGRMAVVKGPGGEVFGIIELD